MTTAFQIGAFQFDAFQEDAVVGTISATDQLDTALISGQVLITGSISATDQLDTANIQGQVLVSGAISTTDQADTASILGNVLVSGAISTTDALDTASILGTVSIIGNIYATDQADTALITGIVQSGVTPDTHDGFTPEEVRRWKQIQKKIAKAEAQKRQALLEKRKLRRKQIEEIVSPPVAQIQHSKLQYLQ